MVTKTHLNFVLEFSFVILTFALRQPDRIRECSPDVAIHSLFYL